MICEFLKPHNCVLLMYYYFHPTEESEIQHQLADINRRYNALDIKIDDRDDELDTALALADRTKPVDDLLDWVTTTEMQMAQAPPMPGLSPLEEMEKELETIMVRLLILGFSDFKLRFQMYSLI